MTVRKRPCDVCGSLESEVLHRQQFVTFDDASGLAGYTVVTCSRCGFVFADGIPNQAAFDRYYREMSKYEPRDEQSSMPSEKRYNYDTIVSAVAQRVADLDARILDVGSASGDLLSVFGERGYRDLVGFDPSPRCAELAQRRHGLRVTNTPISQMEFSGERFDLIILTGVLEHLRDLRPTLQEFVKLLSPAGEIYFCVPDANRFIDYVESPFQHFSLEHINFFTLRSLQALLASADMRLRDSWSSTLRVGSMSEPDINALFGRSGGSSSTVTDAEGRESIARYVRASHRLQDRLSSLLAPLVQSQQPIVVWGTGSLTMHLLADERFAGLNVSAFVDANQNYRGKTICGLPVIAPEDVRDRPDTILVSSYAYENEIVADIRGRYGLNNRVQRLFDADSSMSHMPAGMP